MKKIYQSTLFFYFIFTVFLLIQAQSTQAQSGTAFRDFNNNGIQDTGEPGVGNIIIRSYRADNSLLASATSSTATGAYSLAPAATANQPVRLEFSIPAIATGRSGASADLDFNSYGGSNYGSSVQFVTGPQPNINYALNHPDDYCQANPMMGIPCYINGNTQGNTQVGERDILVKFPYNAYTINQNNIRQSFPNPTEMAVGKNTGSIWGLAYQRSTQKLISAALLKRHMTLGPLGPSGLYITDVVSNTTTSFVQLDQLSPAFNFGSIDSASRDISATGPTFINHDHDAYNLAGRIGIGSIDFSEDQTTLFLTNLYDRKLYSVVVGKPAVVPTAANVTSYAIPNPGCGNADDMRPWAVKVHRGKVYVGVVCTAESTQDASLLTATIYVFDPANSGVGFKQIMQFPLTYPRGYTWWGGGGNRWYPWTNNFNDMLSNPVDGSSAKALPQPILSDLEFDEEGSLILGFADRSGFMLGFRNFSPVLTDTLRYNGATGGDILRTYAVNDTFLLEGNAQAGPYLNPAGQNNGTGPGGGEFFNEERLRNTFNTLPYQDVHGETALGGLALKPGSREVISVLFDPLIPFSAGLKHFSTLNGSVASQGEYQVYEQDPNDSSSPQFGKAGGLGDIEMFCDEAPLEIGNRVWQDTNNDGIQGANESGIKGLIIDLYQGNTKVGTTTTDSSGQYYFNTSNVTLNGANGILPTTTYLIRLADSLGSAALSKYVGISPKNTAIIAGSDANLVAKSIQISYTTANYGQNEHGLDIGLIPTPPCQLVVSATPGNCVPNTNTYAVSGTISLTSAVNGTLTISAGNSQITLPVSATDTAIPYSLTGLLSDGSLHTVSVVSSATTCGSASATYTAPASCSIAPALAVVVTPGSCFSTTNAYTLSGTVSFTNAQAGTITITDGAATTTLTISAAQSSAPFSLTGINSNGSGHTVTVSGAGYAQAASATYTAPASCSIAPALAVVVTPGSCFSTTNAYTLSGTVSFTNAQAGTITITDGAATTTLTISAAQSSAPFSLTGINSNGSGHTVTVSGAGYAQAASATYTAPASCSIAPALAVVVTPGSCFSTTNAYTLSGTVSFTNAQAGTITITDGAATTTLTISAAQSSAPFSLTGINSNGSGHTVTVSGAGYAQAASATYTAPASCSVVLRPKLVLTKTVDRSVARVGDVLTYIVQLANTGQATAKPVSVTDTAPAGLSVLTANTTSGTFAGGIWTIDSLAAGTSTTLTVTGRVIDDGVLTNKALIPGDTATACTSIPIHLCKGYGVELTASIAASTYQWFRNGTIISGATSSTYVATLSGNYSVALNGGSPGNCGTNQCCPVIVEADSVRAFSVVAIAATATCQSSTTLANGQIKVSNYKNDPADATVYTFQYAPGSTFGAAGVTPSVPQPVPANGVLTTTLPPLNTAQPYTVRIFNGRGCYTDITVTVPPTICVCQPESCVPVVIRRIRPTTLR